MKKLCCICLSLLLAAVLVVPAFASYTSGLTLSESEEENLTMIADAIESQYGVTPYFLLDYTIEQGGLDAYVMEYVEQTDKEDVIAFAVSAESYLLYVSASAGIKTDVMQSDQKALYAACREADERGEYYNMAVQYYAALQNILAERMANREAFAGKRMLDEAGLLTNTQTQQLEALLTEISERQQLDVIVRTVDDFNGSNVDDYAEAWYDASGYRGDGCMLLISMADRDWCITSTGYAETAMNPYCRETIGDAILDDLSDGNYADAFRSFAEYTDQFITQARTGEPYSSSHPFKQPFDYAKQIVIGLIVGLVISLVAVSSIKSGYKPVKRQSNANNYLVQDSLMMHAQYDNFLYNHVTRTRKSSESSGGGGGGSHTSSSGRSTSGKF